MKHPAENTAKISKLLQFPFSDNRSLIIREKAFYSKHRYFYPIPHITLCHFYLDPLHPMSKLKVANSHDD